MGAADSDDFFNFVGLGTQFYGIHGVVLPLFPDVQ